jgi:hypothetical protein
MKFGKPEEREKLERELVDFAEWAKPWQLALWIPARRMKLKVAGVLVDQGKIVSPLDQMGIRPATEIYQAHENLWEIRVYAHRDLKDDSKASGIILARLSERLQMVVYDRFGTPVEKPLAVAVRAVAEAKWQTESRRLELLERAERELGAVPTLVARLPSGISTFRSLEDRVSSIADALEAGE